MADANANPEEHEKILKDINNVDDDDDSKANKVVEEVSAGENGVISNDPSTTGAGNDEKKKDEGESKGEMPACDDTEEEVVEEDVKEMNYDEEAVEELLSKLRIGGLPSIGKEDKNSASPLNKLRCLCAKRGRSTLLLFYRLWRDHLVKKSPPPPPPPPPPPRPL